MSLVPQVESIVKEIANDHDSGATPLALYSADCLLEFLQTFPKTTKEDFWQSLVLLGQQLVRSQPDMFAIFYLVDGILYRAQKHLNDEGSLDDVISKTKDNVEHYLLRQEFVLNVVSEEAVQYIKPGDTIITHSYSSMVLRTLITAHKENSCPFKVIVTESRPRFEGHTMARKLAENGINTTLVVDDAAALLMQRCNKVFVGTDLVCREYFVNKIGTLSLALVAQYCGVDFFAVCDTSKWVEHWGRALNRKQYSSKEISEEEIPHCVVENVYFEKVPTELITGIICEEGIVSSDILRKKTFAKTYFADILF